MRFLILTVLSTFSVIAEEGAIPRDGFQLHYRTEGNGQPIVVLSGGPGIEVTYMKGLTGMVPQGFQLVYLEQRGTGRSRAERITAENMTVNLMADDLEALRQHLKLDRLLLAGHSWGGMLAMAYAVKYPKSVDRLILIDSGGLNNDFESWFGDTIESRLYPEETAARQRLMKSIRESGGLTDKSLAENIRIVTPAYFFDHAKGLTVAAELHDGDVHADVLTLIALDRQKGYDLREGLRKLNAPVLIIHGHQDPIGQKTAEDIHAAIPNSTLKYVSRSGHFPWIEQPDQFRKLVAEFLAPKNP